MLIDAPFNDLTSRIIAAAIEVHRHLGPGLLESSYVDSLQYELTSRSLRLESQRAIPAIYKGVVLASSYRADMVVEEQVVVEAKAKERLLPVHEAQLLTYLRMTNLPVGLLINFNVPRLVDGVKRLLNPYHPVVAGLKSTD